MNAGEKRHYVQHTLVKAEACCTAVNRLQK